jgi:hypothetical protein
VSQALPPSASGPPQADTPETAARAREAGLPGVRPHPSAVGIAADPVLGAAYSVHVSDRLRLLITAALIGGPAAVLLNFTLAEIEGWGPPLTVVIMAALGLGLGWYVLHGWNRAIIVYERGYSYREGGETVFFAWQEVRGVRAEAAVTSAFGGRLKRTRYRYVVGHHSGDQVVLTRLYRRVGALGDAITAAVEASIERAADDLLQRKGRIAFGEPGEGSLAFTHDGLLHDANPRTGAEARLLPWAAFGGFRVADRALTVLDRDGAVWVSLPLREIENVGLLVRWLRARTPRA